MHLLVSGNLAQILLRVAGMMICCVAWQHIIVIDVTAKTYDDPLTDADACPSEHCGCGPKDVVVQVMPTTFRVGERGPGISPLVFQRDLDMLRVALRRLKDASPDRAALRVVPHDDVDYATIVAVIDVGAELGYRAPQIAWAAPPAR